MHSNVFKWFIKCAKICQIFYCLPNANFMGIVLFWEAGFLRNLTKNQVCTVQWVSIWGLLLDHQVTLSLKYTEGQDL